MIATPSKDSKIKNTDDQHRTGGSIASYNIRSLLLILSSCLLFCLIFYHATLTIESDLMHDKSNLYQRGMIHSLPLTHEMTAETIIKIQDFVSDLKSQDPQLSTIDLFTKDGRIAYSSNLGLIGDHILPHWQDLLSQDPLTSEISSDKQIALIYPISSTNDLFLAFTFQKESFMTLLSKHNSIIAFFGFGSCAIGIYLFNRHLIQLGKFNDKTDPLIMEFEKQKSKTQAELNELSKDLKSYETL